MVQRKTAKAKDTATVVVPIPKIAKGVDAKSAPAEAKINGNAKAIMKGKDVKLNGDVPKAQKRKLTKTTAVQVSKKVSAPAARAAVKTNDPKVMKPKVAELNGDIPKTKSKLKAEHTIENAEPEPKVLAKNLAKQPAQKRKQQVQMHSEVKRLKVQLVALNIQNGTVLVVGEGTTGQLGLGVDIEQKMRVSTLPFLSKIVAVAAGGLHSVCVDNEGKVFSWGCNDEGALGRVTLEEEDNFECGIVNVDGKVVALSAGDCHTAALTQDGKVFAWGMFRDNSGTLGFIEEGNKQVLPRQILNEVLVTKIASGENHLLLLSVEGNLYSCGNGESGQLGRLAAAFAERDARRKGQIENLLKPKLVKVLKHRKVILFDDVWAGASATFARARDTGEIYACGLNNFHQLGDPDNKNEKYLLTMVKSFENHKWKQFSPATHHSLALDEAGTVYSVGRHEYGRLGLANEDAIVPTVIETLKQKRVVDISAVGCVSFAVTDEGEAFSFGGCSSQLGHGNDEEHYLVPTRVVGKQLEGKLVSAVSAGGQHTLYIVTQK